MEWGEEPLWGTQSMVHRVHREREEKTRTLASTTKVADVHVPIGSSIQLAQFWFDPRGPERE